MSKSRKIQVLKKTVTVQRLREDDYICLTDIARYKESDRTDHVIQNWIRNRNTIEFLGIWETLNNPDFKPLEFDGFRRQAGLNSFVLTPKQWIDVTGAVGIISKQGRYGGTRAANPGEKGNIRDQANAAQLVCLVNLENLNALFIKDGLEQPERLARLNRIAIEQMELLTDERAIKPLRN